MDDTENKLQGLKQMHVVASAIWVANGLVLYIVLYLQNLGYALWHLVCPSAGLRDLCGHSFGHFLGTEESTGPLRVTMVFLQPLKKCRESPFTQR